MDSSFLLRASQIFGALSHPTRLRIVELLSEHERTVNSIAETLSLPQSGTSQHLAVLTRAGVLSVDQRGSLRYYRVKGPRMTHIVELIGEFCEIHGLQGVESKPVVDLTPEGSIIG